MIPRYDSNRNMDLNQAVLIPERSQSPKAQDTDFDNEEDDYYMGPQSNFFSEQADELNGASKGSPPISYIIKKKVGDESHADFVKVNRLRKGSENLNESPGGDLQENEMGLSYTENSFLVNDTPELQQLNNRQSLTSYPQRVSLGAFQDPST